VRSAAIAASICLVTRHQIERIAARRQQAFGRFRNRGRGADDENSAHGAPSGLPAAPCHREAREQAGACG